jgi:hypothetical protein
VNRREQIKTLRREKKLLRVNPRTSFQHRADIVFAWVNFPIAVVAVLVPSTDLIAKRLAQTPLHNRGFFESGKQESRKWDRAPADRTESTE